MTRVRLIVTGDLERSALSNSLRRYFPELTFLPPVQLHSMTSSPAPSITPGASPPAQIRRVASAIAAECFDRSRHVADAIVAIDDLELVNQHRANVVTEWLRIALDLEIEERRAAHQTAGELAHQLRERASLHFMVPMVEAYFFADPGALTAVGLPPTVRPRLVHPDVEHFLTDDPAYLAYADAENERRTRAGRARRRFDEHPKEYLQHLCVREAGRGYIETRDGSAALEHIDWIRVCERPDAARHVRSLFADLADLAQVPNPLGDGQTAHDTWRRPQTPERDRVLRNL